MAASRFSFALFASLGLVTMGCGSTSRCDGMAPQGRDGPDGASLSEEPPAARITADGGGPDSDTSSQAAALVLPRPTGPYAVGAVVKDLIDSSRDEPRTSQTEDRRRVVIQVFYPAEGTPTPEAPYMLPLEGARLESEFYGLPRGWAPRVRTHVLDRPSPAPGLHPVLVFSHGFASPRAFYTSLLADLASFGYVVVSVSHAFDSCAVEFSDGTVAPGLGLDALAMALKPDAPEVADGHVARWAEDQRFVLDEVSRMSASDPLFGGRLDMTKLGIFGHSLGGATATETLATDGRVLAAINIDGMLAGPARSRGGRILSKPYMLVLGESHGLDSGDITLKGTFDQATAPAYALVIRGAEHGDFSELGIVEDFFQGAIASYLRLSLGTVAGIPARMIGAIGSERALSITSSYVRAFFDQHLARTAGGLLDPPTPRDGYPEVNLTARNAKGS